MHHRPFLRLVSSARIQLISLLLLQIGSDINWNANTSLPRGTNAALGDDAVFTCEFGGPRNFNAAPHLNFELSLPDVDGENYTTLTTICRDWTECDKWSPANHSVGVSIQSVQISDQNDYYGEQYRYNIRLAAVMTHHNGSIFSCSLSEHQSKSTDYFNGKDVIQWKGSAQLFVHEADTATIPVSAAETSQKLVAPVSAVVVVIVLISSAVITVLLLAAVKFFKKKRRSLCHGLVATGMCTFTNVSKDCVFVGRRVSTKISLLYRLLIRVGLVDSYNYVPTACRRYLCQLASPVGCKYMVRC